jgi:hypothetical protein
MSEAKSQTSKRAATTTAAPNRRANTTRAIGKAETPTPKRADPAASVAKAKAAFKEFTLSRHAKGQPPPGYVAPGTDPKPKHRELMDAKLSNLQEASATRRLNLALTPAQLKQLVPSYSADAAKASITEVTTVLKKYSRGTTFVQKGDPTLRRLALQSEVNQIMQSFSKAKK